MLESGVEDMGARKGLILLVMASAAVVAGEFPRPDSTALEPRRSGLLEKAGVTLTLLDVEVTDEEGRPVRGLRKEDFAVRLDGKDWPIYSVDALCPESPEASAPDTRPEVARSAGDRTPALGEAGERVAAGEGRQFVLYLDFSQLQMDGRANAMAAARSWIVHDLEPGDRVLVAAYATRAGLRRLTRFTDRREELLAALDLADKDLAFLDPFPSLYESRIDECLSCCRRCIGGMACRHCCPVCLINPHDEYFHGRRSLRALRRLLEGLEQVPGRKLLLLFHQNGIIFPVKVYPFVTEREIFDNYRLLEQVGAAATSSRTAVYPLTSGSAIRSTLSDQSVNFGANLADFTGGKYNRGPTDLTRVLRAAGRTPPCTYRIALEPPRETSGHVYQAIVEARGRALPYRYRVRFLDEMDRWLNQATAVLERPEEARDLKVTAALVPVEATRRGWTVEASIVLAPESLTLVRAPARVQGGWEVGGLLRTIDGSKAWEMLGVSEMTCRGCGDGRSYVVHRRRFEDLKPGRYYLAGFVRDRTAGVFGGAESQIDLPTRGDERVVGPMEVRYTRTCVESSLPLMSDTRTPRSVARASSRCVVPGTSEPTVPGEPLTMWTWICSRGTLPSPEHLLRYVAKDGTPIFRFESPAMEAAGECVRVADRIDTAPLSAGSYTYHLVWKPVTGAEPISAESGFEIVERVPREEGATKLETKDAAGTARAVTRSP